MAINVTRWNICLVCSALSTYLLLQNWQLFKTSRNRNYYFLKAFILCPSLVSILFTMSLLLLLPRSWNCNVISCQQEQAVEQKAGKQAGNNDLNQRQKNIKSLVSYWTCQDLYLSLSIEMKWRTTTIVCLASNIKEEKRWKLRKQNYSAINHKDRVSLMSVLWI